ncbi:MAG: hypothetical protein A2017_06225 [Lentisphaerae bacterium GWF2_44_16]|nr:MAG: hypothetical protein A2017_06225 [Lentisphaerae bacterium GWF2_44_16]
MDIKKKIDDFSSGISSGLRDDPELMLDVKEEIKSHIEDSCESFKDDGKGEEESFELAMKNFGPSGDIGQDIISANRKRMKLRAAIKLVFRAIIVPLSVILALYIFLYRIDSLKYFMNLNSSLGFFIETKRNPEKLWKSEPQNKIYHGNYITDIINKGDKSKIKPEITAAEKFEPQNARYNYILAGIILDETSKLEDEKSWKRKNKKNPANLKFKFLEPRNDKSEILIIEDISKPRYGKSEILIIEDIPKFELGLKEFLKGARKEYYNAYGKEMLELELKKLPPAKHYEDILLRISIAAGSLLPDLSPIRNINRKLVSYAGYLAEKGRNKEAIELLDGWNTMLHQLPEHQWTLIEKLVLFAIASNGKNVAEFYKKLGEPLKAKQVEFISQKITELQNEYWPRDEKFKRIITKKERNNTYLAENHSGILGGMLLPALGSGITLNKEELAPMRELDYLIFERKMLEAAILLFIVIMLVCGVITLYRIFRNGKDDAPVLLLPDFKDTLKIIIYGIILPLGFYIIYSRFTYFGRHEFSAPLDLIKRAVEFFTMSVFSVILVFQLTKTSVTKKAAALSIIQPTKLKVQKLKLKAAVTAIILLSLCMIFAKDVDIVYGIPAILVLCSWIIFSIVVFLKYKVKNEKKIRRGTITRSMIPVFSLTLLALTLICHPILEAWERHVVRENQNNFYNFTSFTKYEGKLVQELNEKIGKILKDAKTIRLPN